MQKIATNLTILRQNKTRSRGLNPKFSKPPSLSSTFRARWTQWRSRRKMMTSSILTFLIPMVTRINRLKTSFNWIRSLQKNLSHRSSNLRSRKTFSHLMRSKTLHRVKYRWMGSTQCPSTHRSHKDTILSLCSNQCRGNTTLGSSSLLVALQWLIQISISTSTTLQTSQCIATGARCPIRWCPKQCINSRWAQEDLCHRSTSLRKCRRSKSLKRCGIWTSIKSE